MLSGGNLEPSSTSSLVVSILNIYYCAKLCWAGCQSGFHPTSFSFKISRRYLWTRPELKRSPAISEGYKRAIDTTDIHLRICHED